MKKKNILLFILCIALLTPLSSCFDLDEEVYDKLPADDFGNTEVEINALLGTVYNTVKTYWPNNFMYLSECGGSMAVTPTRKGGDWYDGGQYRELYMHTWTSQTSQIKGSWSAATSAIGTCNASYATVEKSTALSDEVKSMRLAEIQGIRAFWIYVMLDYWGNIPLVTEYEETVTQLPSNTSRQEVFDWLLQEVNSIAEKCPDPSVENYSRFTKGSAYFLLAKLYLNAEAWGVTVSDGYTNAYKKVSEYCDKINAFGYYSLENNWKDAFAPGNDNSTEAIFVASFSSQDANNQNNMMKRSLHYKDYLALGGSYSGCWNGICAQPDYVRLFETEDPRFKGTFLTGKQYYYGTTNIIMTDHGFELNHTIDVSILPGTERDGTNWGDVNQHDGARCNKWEYEKSLVDAMENDFFIFRLADVYLMKAEALIRSGGSTTEAATWVNKVRERAFGNSNRNYTTVTLDNVLLERRLELAWEAWSRQDDIRFGKFETPLWPQSDCIRTTGEHLKLYPISQDAWQTNQNLKQNPGYAAF